MKSKHNFDKQKAYLIYEVQIKELREKHSGERRLLFDDLQRRNMRRQGPGYQQINDLVSKQIKEVTEMYVDSLLSTIDESERVKDEGEKELIHDMVNFLEATVESENNGIRSRLHADGWINDKAFSEAMLRALPNKSLATRQYLTNKIRLKVRNVNDTVDKKHKNPIKALLSNEFFKMGKSMLFKWVWGIVGAILLGFLAYWWKSCDQSEKHKHETIRNHAVILLHCPGRALLKLR